MILMHWSARPKLITLLTVTALARAASAEGEVARAWREGTLRFASTDPSAASPQEASPAVSDPSSDVPRGDQGNGAATRRTDHFRIGVLGGVGFPRPLSIEGMVKLEKIVGLGVEYSLLPKLSISGVDTHFWAIAADARVFPFRNAFFVGLRAGRQHLGGDAVVTVPGYGSVAEAMAVDTTFLNPRTGFLWTWEPGITLGIDIGVQIPISASASSTLPPGTQVSDDLRSVTNSLGRYVLPTVDLLKIGVLL